jgi:hypothetical protein
MCRKEEHDAVQQSMVGAFPLSLSLSLSLSLTYLKNRDVPVLSQRISKSMSEWSKPG